MRTRRRFSAEFKVEVALETVKDDETVAELVTRPIEQHRAYSLARA